MLADNEPVEQEKALKFNSLLTNASRANVSGRYDPQYAPPSDRDHVWPGSTLVTRFLYLVRHGQAEPHDGPLSPAGAEQARLARRRMNAGRSPAGSAPPDGETGQRGNGAKNLRRRRRS